MEIDTVRQEEQLTLNVYSDVSGELVTFPFDIVSLLVWQIMFGKIVRLHNNNNNSSLTLSLSASPVVPHTVILTISSVCPDQSLNRDYALLLLVLHTSRRVFVTQSYWLSGTLR